MDSSIDNERSTEGIDTLISFCGDFPSETLPLYTHFFDNLQRHLFLYDSTGPNDDSDAIRRGIRRYEIQRRRDALTMAIDFEKDLPKSPDDLLESLLRLCGGSFQGTAVNLAGLDAARTLLLGCALRREGARILSYDRYDNRASLLHPDDGIETFACRGQSIREHLTLLGYEVLEEHTPQELETHKEAIYALGLQLDRYKEFADAASRQGSARDLHGYDAIRETLERMGRLDDLKYIQGTLFEEYVCLLLDDTGWFDEVATGVRLRIDEGVENEFDVLMIRDNHLHALECKLVRRLDGEHTVYKLDRLIRYLDGDGRGMILSVGAPNETRSASGSIRRQFTRGDLARARHGEILVHQRHRLDPKEFLLDIYDWFVRPYETPSR